MIWLTILKYICLTFAIAYTFSNVTKAIWKFNISWQQLLIMGASIAGFVALHFEAGFMPTF